MLMKVLCVVFLALELQVTVTAIGHEKFERVNKSADVLSSTQTTCSCLPEGFVFLRDVDPSILEDIRYYSAHNFMGRRVEGYNYPACVLTEQAASALAQVQSSAAQHGYSLKVYDCYRPQRAVDDFVRWANNSYDTLTKLEFYPTIDKLSLFPEYIATKSGHSRGSTMDLTLVQLPAKAQEEYLPGQPLVPCFSNTNHRFKDNSVDMGTGFDCLNALAHTVNVKSGSVQEQNRQLLLRLMSQQGFVNYADEWWHFTMTAEPFPSEYFDFPIQRECARSN